VRLTDISAVAVLVPSETVQRFTAERVLFLAMEAEYEGENMLAPGVGMDVDPDRWLHVHVYDPDPPDADTFPEDDTVLKAGAGSAMKSVLFAEDADAVNAPPPPLAPCPKKLANEIVPDVGTPEFPAVFGTRAPPL